MARMLSGDDPAWDVAWSAPVPVSTWSTAAPAPAPAPAPSGALMSGDDPGSAWLAAPAPAPTYAPDSLAAWLNDSNNRAGADYSGAQALGVAGSGSQYTYQGGGDSGAGIGYTLNADAAAQLAGYTVAMTSQTDTSTSWAVKDSAGTVTGTLSTPVARDSWLDSIGYAGGFVAALAGFGLFDAFTGAAVADSAPAAAVADSAVGSGAWLGEGVASGVPAWDAAAAAQAATTTTAAAAAAADSTVGASVADGSGAWLGEGVASGVPAWDAAAAAAAGAVPLLPSLPVPSVGQALQAAKLAGALLGGQQPSQSTRGASSAPASINPGGVALVLAIVAAFVGR